MKRIDRCGPKQGSSTPTWRIRFSGQFPRDVFCGYVARQAEAYGLTGIVGRDGGDRIVEINSSRGMALVFMREVLDGLPDGCKIESHSIESAVPYQHKGFSIRDSDA